MEKEFYELVILSNFQNQIFKLPLDFVRMVCLPFEDDIHEKYSGVDLSLSGWGFTTVRNEEKSKGTQYSNIISTTIINFQSI